MATLVITVPHSYCRRGDDQDHLCDLVAEQAGHELQAIAAPYFSRVSFYLSDRPRSELDLNREEAYNSIWRVALRERIEDLQKLGPVVLLDLHSYPNGSYPGVFTVLYVDKNRDYVPNLGPSVHWLQGSPVNSIVTEFHAKLRWALLLEVNEESKPEQRKDVFTKLVQFLARR